MLVDEGIMDARKGLKPDPLEADVPVIWLESPDDDGMPDPVACAEIVGRVWAKEAPKLLDGWKGLTWLPPNPVGCGAKGAGLLDGGMPVG